MEVFEQIKNIIVDETNPQQIILFGSRARGDNRPDSDYDLLIVFAKPYEVSPGLHPVDKIYRAFYKRKIRVSTDILAVTSDKYDELSEETGLIYNHVKKEGKIIYSHV